MVLDVIPRFALALAGLAATTVVATPVVASDSLATPITTEIGNELWPLELEVEIRDLSEPAGTALPAKRVVVPDGHRTTWASSVWTSSGRRFFELDVVARHHPRDMVELEWDVVVSRAPVLPMDVGEYVLHRLALGPKPRLGPKQVEVARSDIVSTMGEGISETVEIAGKTYEIRILAHSLRG